MYLFMNPSAYVLKSYHQNSNATVGGPKSKHCREVKTFLSRACTKSHSAESEHKMHKVRTMHSTLARK